MPVHILCMRMKMYDKKRPCLGHKSTYSLPIIKHFLSHLSGPDKDINIKQH